MTSLRRVASSASPAVLVLLAGCWGTDENTLSSPADVRYAFVVLGENGQVVARAITTATTCPSITVDGHTAQMGLRAVAGTVAPRPTAYDKKNTTPTEFPVTVCDTLLPIGTARVTVGERVLPLPKRHAQKMLLIADTGCRIKAPDLYQTCDDAQWPFRPLADLAAAQAPDLVIHLGDDHYRETQCPVGYGCYGSPYGFSWSSWEPDFFAPGRALLAAAPWVLVRGDHETCDRGGQGWWRLLDPRPPETGRDCNVEANDAIGNYSDPYVVPVDDDVAVVVFDSAVTGDRKLDTKDPQYVQYLAQIKQAFGLAAAYPHAFFMNHQLILGYNSDGKATALPGNAALQSVLEGVNTDHDVQFPSNIEAVLSGHVHMLQIVSFATPQPPIFIPGNGGTQLVEDFTAFPDPPTPLPGAMVASLLHTAQFGFMTMERAGAGWTLKAFDRTGRVLTTCALAARKASCAPLNAG